MRDDLSNIFEVVSANLFTFLASWDHFLRERIDGPSYLLNLHENTILW